LSELVNVNSTVSVNFKPIEKTVNSGAGTLGDVLCNVLHGFFLDTFSHGWPLVDSSHDRGHFYVFGCSLHFGETSDSLQRQVVSLFSADLFQHAVKLNLRDHLGILVARVVQLLLETCATELI